MKRLFAAISCVVGLMATTPAQAAPILVTTADTVLGTVTVDLVGGTQTLLVSGSSAADVVDGVVVNSGIIEADVPAGTDDAIFFDLVDEFLLFDFDETNLVGLGGPALSLLVAGSGLSPISDPALAAFVAPNNTGLFSLFGDPVFTTDPETGAPTSAVFTYVLESIAAPTQVEPIPEPATIGLVGMGILAAARARNARRKKNVA